MLAPIHVAPDDDPFEVASHVQDRMQSALSEMAA
jgi:hypothetical protein